MILKIKETITLKVTYANGDSDITRFNGTFEEAQNYYLNKTFNIGTVNDNMQKCIAVDEVSDDTTLESVSTENNELDEAITYDDPESMGRGDCSPIIYDWESTITRDIQRLDDEKLSEYAEDDLQRIAEILLDNKQSVENFNNYWTTKYAKAVKFIDNQINLIPKDILDKVSVSESVEVKKLTEAAIRKYTNKLLDLVAEEGLSSYDVLLAALNYMSEAEVEDMAKSNCFIDDEEDFDESFNANNKLTEDWSRGLIINIAATPESVKAACEAGKLDVPAVNSEGFENCIGQHSLIVRFPNGNNIFDFLNIYDDVCEFHYTLYDKDIKHEVDGGISAINRIIKTQQITDSVRHIIDRCANALKNADIEITNTNVRVIGSKGDLEFNESLTKKRNVKITKKVEESNNQSTDESIEGNFDVSRKTIWSEIGKYLNPNIYKCDLPNIVEDWVDKVVGDSDRYGDFKPALYDIAIDGADLILWYMHNNDDGRYDEKLKEILKPRNKNFDFSQKSLRSHLSKFIDANMDENELDCIVSDFAKNIFIDDVYDDYEDLYSAIEQAAEDAVYYVSETMKENSKKSNTNESLSEDINIELSETLDESIDSVRAIKDALNKTVTGVNDNALGSTGAFASWIAQGFDLDTVDIVDVAVAMDFDVYETNIGYFGTPDWLIMFPGKDITTYPDFDDHFITDAFKKIN